MTKLSFSDKLGILLKITTSNKIYLIVVIAMIVLGYALMSTNKRNAKGNKRLYLSIYAIIIGLILIIYHSSLSKMLDYMMNNLFIAIYFPNLAIYLAAIIITNIIVWISIFNFKTPKIIKRINIAMYCIMTYILILILNVISDNKLDVFTQSSVYGNSNAQALIELSSVIFMTWIIFLIIYKIIKPFIVKKKVVKKKVTKTVTVKKESSEEPIEVLDVPEEKEYRPIPAPYVVKATNNNTIKVEKETKTINPYEELLTIDDYKLLLNILKEHKERERLEAEQKARREAEQSKFFELQELYKSVR